MYSVKQIQIVLPWLVLCHVVTSRFTGETWFGVSGVGVATTTKD